jgi:type IX secretion system substrate protein
MKRYSFLFLLFFGVSVVSAHAQPVPVITTIAGNGTPGNRGDGMPATVAQLKEPQGIAVDTLGNIYVGDQNHVIRKVNSAGIIITIAGNDTSGFSGDHGPATAAKITWASGIAVDKKGNVYFCDVGNNRVRKIDMAGIITTFAGNGSNVFSGDGNPATSAGGLGAAGICIDDIGNVYISAHEEIRKVDTFGIITAYAGNGGGGYSGDYGPATAAKLNGNGQIAFDIHGNLYISDNTRIRKVNGLGIISTVAGIASTGYSGDGGPATIASINETPGVFPDKCGNFYIADYSNNRIRLVNDAGIISTFAGNGYGGVDNSGSYGSYTGGYTGDGGPATAAELYGPSNLYLDKQGNIYFTDYNNHVVRYIHMDSCRNTLEVANPPGLPKGDVKVYPNPATDELNVTGVQQAAKYNLYNVTGASVLKGTLQEGSNVLSLRYFAPGVYILELVGDSGERKMVRVVKE